jgi:hypothetical protein
LIGIGSADIYIDTPSLSRDELEEYSRTLFEQWESYVDGNLELSDYSLSLSVEDGSVKALGKVGVGLYALYIGIGQYGSFMSGVQTIKSQVSDVSEYLGQQAVEPFTEVQIKPKIRKRGEALSRLEGIFKKVEAGKISVDEALEESKAILGNDESVPEFYEGLKESLIEVPDHRSENQLELDVNTAQLVPIEEKSNSNSPKTPRPKQPPVDHYRVVVWRESREERVNVTVSKV